MSRANKILLQFEILEVNDILNQLERVKLGIAKSGVSKAITQFKKQQKGKDILDKKLIVNLLQDIRKIVGSKLSSKLAKRIKDIITRLGGGTELVL